MIAAEVDTSNSNEDDPVVNATLPDPLGTSDSGAIPMPMPVPVPVPVPDDSNSSNDNDNENENENENDILQSKEGPDSEVPSSSTENEDEDENENEDENNATGIVTSSNNDILVPVNAYHDEDEEDSTKTSGTGTGTGNGSPKGMLPRTLSLGSMFDCGGGELMSIQKMFAPKQLLADVNGDGDSTTTGIDKNMIDAVDGEEEETMKFSDLSDNSRNIWVVTTAALPWRTGTAINPFLRCLYLVQRRLDLYRAAAAAEAAAESNNDKKGNSANENGMKEDEEKINGEESISSSPSHFKPGKITLVIPWLDNPDDTAKLYGGHIVKVGEEGKQEQIDWIRNYASEKCGMKDEMEYLDILFYSAAYWPAFGSIFPTVDICSLIPNEEADVAILEEPEHLNWFRMQIPKGKGDDKDEDSGPTSFCTRDIPKDLVDDSKKSKKSIQTAPESSDADMNINHDVSTGTDVKDVKDVIVADKETENSNEHELGWAHKFKFVVGVIHTNYSAYMKQYGIGTSIVAAPAISALSSMVVRAYCHKVIRLSGVIPNYAKWKEVTCNVHGVRGDFLNVPVHAPKPPSKSNEDEKNGDIEKKTERSDCSQIYYIGKFLWAKGFDRMLKIQERYRRSNPNKQFFPIDIYGSGPDEKAIVRAFHGRLNPQEFGASDNEDSDNDSSGSSKPGTVSSDGKDVSRGIFSGEKSIREQLKELTRNSSNQGEMPKAFSDAKNYINLGFELVVPDGDSIEGCDDVVVMERRKLVEDKDTETEQIAKTKPNPNPISIIADISEKSVGTGIATTKAVKTLADSAFKAGFAMTFTPSNVDDEDETGSKPGFTFDPPKTIYELRRSPIPARFLGVKDHALLKDMPYKIFLNPSVTEVLCTTTAEALAMGKFVIIPKHPSNDFFLQFPNCLAYDNLKDCVAKIQWALQNDPSPLTKEQAHIFTWHAATDRLIEASIITNKEAKNRIKDGHDKSDSRMAWLHSETGKQGQFIQGLFGSPISSGEDAKSVNGDSEEKSTTTSKS